MILASILARYAEQRWCAWVSEEGWEVVKKYIQNAHIYTEGRSPAPPLLKVSTVRSNVETAYVKERNVKCNLCNQKSGCLSFLNI